MSRRYCVYCGRIAHRCECAKDNSSAQQFFARSNRDFSPQWMSAPYKRGVPPQIKRRERNILKRNYANWYQELVEKDGMFCLNCGISEAESNLVIDHIQSIAKGGLSTFDNLQLLCDECNRIKGKLCIDCRSN